MAKFVIQSREVNGQIIPMQEFGYLAIEAVEYNEWLRGEKIHSVFMDDSKDGFKHCATASRVIPVGSVEYVSSFFRECCGIDSIVPINIPEVLDKFANRKIERLHGISKLPTEETKFIKSMTGIKKYSAIVESTYVNDFFPKDDYIVSDILEDIQSEWRCFIYNGRLIDARCYSFTKNPFQIPDYNTVISMISSYKPSPVAYTLDVCVDSSGVTSIIEVHNFFSCGLYGFCDYEMYLKMLIAGINWEYDRLF